MHGEGKSFGRIIMSRSMYRKLQCFAKTTDFRKAVKMVEVPLIEPKEKQIRVRNIYAGVNATDINITAARYFTDGQVPFDIGLEALGMVDAIGANVERKLALNQPVLVMKRENPGCFAEYLYANEEELVPVPELKPEYLVSYVNGLTATIGLDKAGRVQPGDKVLVTAAAGGTGQIVVQWAKHRGAHVIAMTSSAAKAEYLKQLGADFIINYRQDDLGQVLDKHYPDGVDVVWETIGGDVYTTLFKRLARRGRLVIVGTITGYRAEDGGIVNPEIRNLTAKLLMGSHSLTGFMLFDYLDYFPEYLPELIGRIHKGQIRAQVDLGQHSDGGLFAGLDQVCRAEEYLHGGRNMGKVVVLIQEP